MDRSGWIDAKTHRRDGACSASVSSDSSASEVLVLISIAQTSPSQLQAQNSSKNIICWRGDLRPKSPLFPSATLHCSSLSLFVSLPVVSNPGKYLRNQLGCKINWMTIQEPDVNTKNNDKTLNHHHHGKETAARFELSGARLPQNRHPFLCSKRVCVDS